MSKHKTALGPYGFRFYAITNSFALVYSYTLRAVIPFSLGYYGVGATIYLGLFLLSFSILNRSKPIRTNMVETVRLASAPIVLFELGLFIFVPYFMDKWLLDVFRATPLRAFTNWDLLHAGTGNPFLSQA